MFIIYSILYIKNKTNDFILAQLIFLYHFMIIIIMIVVVLIYIISLILINN